MLQSTFASGETVCYWNVKLIMEMDNQKYDIIVVGAGHAGIEASLAAARMGCSVLLMTMDMLPLAECHATPQSAGQQRET